MYNIDKKSYILEILTYLKQVFSRRLYKERKIKAYV
jgi:hypothetical protein